MNEKEREKERERVRRNWEAHMKVQNAKIEKAGGWDEYMKKQNSKIEKEKVVWDEHMKRQNAKLEDHFDKAWTGKEAYRKEMNKRKQRIVKEYGKEPTVCYFYYLLNAVDYTGEENLRKSFESIQGRGDEVIVGDYSSTDDTVKIAKEYGFKIVDVEKTPGIGFHVSKIVNKITKETDCTFMMDLDVHIEYPKNINDIVVKWIRENDITKKILALRGWWIDKFGELKAEWGFCTIVLSYVPYLLEARGHDERTYMGWGCGHYYLNLMEQIYNLKYDNIILDDMIHKHHIKEKTKASEEILGISNMSEMYIPNILFSRSLTNELKKDFDEGIKKVKNSYW